MKILKPGVLKLVLNPTPFNFHVTSVPEPGRKFLTVMVLPGAGKGASIIPLMKGCTRAGEMALRFSTSSRIYKRHIFITHD